MRVTSGIVRAGKVELNESVLVEGTSVVVLSRDHDSGGPLSPEELAELEAGLAEADRGETISGIEVLASIRRFG